MAGNVLTSYASSVHGLVSFWFSIAMKPSYTPVSRMHALAALTSVNLPVAEQSEWFLFCSGLLAGRRLRWLRSALLAAKPVLDYMPHGVSGVALATMSSLQTYFCY